ncbi:MAG: GGDEF domain-containing protein [Magnetospirillum sp.]|nr:GGDEF domain-containing protein [Magnetospirillum sp.]
MLEHEAHHDVLTGLPNRAFFNETLEFFIALSRREERRFAVAFLDLNGFKAINDELGHDMGDLALTEVAKTLKSVLRESDFAARLGGDEFSVIIPAIDSVSGVCEHIAAAISELTPPELQGRRLGTSIGVAVFPDDGNRADDLMAIADTRMYEQKKARKAGTTSPAVALDHRA